MYGNLGDGLASAFRVLTFFAVIGIGSMIALVVIAANTWDCNVERQR